MNEIPNCAAIDGWTGEWFSMERLLLILRPIIEEYFFYIGDFEATYLGIEAESWAATTIDYTAPVLPGSERLLISYKNALFLARNTEQMHEYSVWFASKGNVLLTGQWVGGFEDQVGLRLAFHSESQLASALQLMEAHGYRFVRADPMPVPEYPPGYSRGSYKPLLSELNKGWTGIDPRDARPSF